MSAELYTEIKINATTEKVWRILTEFEKYGEWNPFIKSITGEVKVGNTIVAEIDGMKFKPIVLAFEDNKELRWKGKLGFNAIFAGEHRFVLVDNKDGSTIFQHAEVFEGILLFLLKGKLFKDTRVGFEAMNKSLKAKCEGH